MNVPAFVTLVLAAGLLTGCARDQSPRVEILGPVEAAEVAGPSVRIQLSATGIEIAAATDPRPGTGHHHLFLDVEPVAPGAAIPVGIPGIVHLGAGQSEYVFESLTPGSHTVIAVLASPAHIALDPPARDTVRFTVR